MKKLILSLLLIPVFCYSQRHIVKHVITKQQKAQKLITDYLLTNLNNPHSYEPVSFTDLDSVFNDINESGIYEFSKTRLNELYTHKLPMLESVLTYLKNASVDKDVLEKYKDSITQTQSDIEGLRNQIDTIEHRYKRAQIGWKMYHRFRGRNAYNALVLQTYVGYFDLDITQILSIKNDED